MTWPFENDTNFFVKKIAKADLKSHKMKTVLLSIIIILSTFLMAVVFIVFLNDALDRANSSAYHAMYQAASPETIAILETEPQFEQQRVAIARALITKPAIILADEPTGNLDSKTSADVLGLLKRTSGEFHQTIVMITHNTEIAQLADRIVRIEDGRIAVERR